MSPARRRGRAALDHLARAVAHADARRLGDDLGPVDAWRVRRAFRWAERRVPPSAADPVGAKVHRLRVAWLAMAGEIHDGDPAIHDPVAADARYHAALAALGPPPGPRPGWSARGKLVALGCVAGAIALTIVVVRVANAPASPVGDGALLAPEQEEAFADALTQWVIGLDRLTRARHDGALDRVVQEAQDTLDARRLRALAPEVRTFFGEAAAGAFDEVLDAAEVAARGRRWPKDADALAEAVRALNRRLAEADRAYFVESYAARYHDGRPETALFLFRVAARRTWVVDDDDRIDALHLRRIDSLNIIQHLLGYTSERMDVAALLLDRLENEVVTRVGPSLAPDHPMPLHVDDDDAGAPWVARVRAVAGERVREAFADELPDDGPGLAALGSLLARRLALVERVNAELSDRGLRFRFERLEIPEAQLDELEGYLGRQTRRELEALQSELLDDAHRARFARVLARHARPVEQHEVQHRIDYGLGERFGPPDALLALLGVEPGSDLARHDDLLRTAHELSAYTTEIARDPRWAALNLTLLTEHLLEGGGGAELHAAILVLDGLADELALPGARVASKRPVDASLAASAWLALMAVPGDNLARAAAALWTRWYGRALPTLRPEVSAP